MLEELLLNTEAMARATKVKLGAKFIASNHRRTNSFNYNYSFKRSITMETT